MKRRELLKFGALAAGATVLTGCANDTAPTPETATVSTEKSGVARVVVVGGGPGGISVARNIKRTNPEIEVTLVERNAKYSTCFGSNWVFAGIKSMKDMTFNYYNLSNRHGVNVIHDEVTGVDVDKQQVTLAMGKPLEYDRLVVSPGISFRWDMIEGHDETTSFMAPHAWQAGHQTLMLKAQLDAMPENGTMVLVSPPNPFRCPPGPYERVGMIAQFMKNEKPKAKLVILDAKDKFSKQALFIAGWEYKYGFNTDNSIIEWVSKSNGGDVVRLDPHKKEVVTKNGDTIKADVINYIPAQKANITAVRMGLVDDSGWCPISHKTFESKLVPNIHVLGDSSIASPMPKSAFASDTQGIVCAAAIVALLGEKPVNENPIFGNQCFSLISESYGISVAAGYALDENNRIVKTGGALFPIDGNFAGQARGAFGWYKGMAGTMFN